MNAEDRFRAIIRSPEYIEDSDHLLKLYAKKLVQTIWKDPGFAKRFIPLLGSKDYPRLFSFCKSYPTVFKPIITEISKLEKKWDGLFIAALTKQRWAFGEPAVCVSWADKNRFKNLLSAAMQNPRGNFVQRKNQILSLNDNLTDRPDFIKATLKDGRHLNLVVDLTAKKADILKEFEGSINLYRKYVERPKSRERKTSVDPWKVYDMHHEEGKSFLKIAKEIFGFKDNPSYNPRAKAKYEQVVTAYKKAKKMIEQVTPTT